MQTERVTAKKMEQKSPSRNHGRDPAPTLESETGERRRIEVTVLRNVDGTRRVVLQDLSFGQGIGWYAQKTIRLDPEQADALLKALCCTREPTACNQRRTDRPTQSRKGDGKIVYLDPPIWSST